MKNRRYKIRFPYCKAHNKAPTLGSIKRTNLGIPFSLLRQAAMDHTSPGAHMSMDLWITVPMVSDNSSCRILHPNALHFQKAQGIVWR